MVEQESSTPEQRQQWRKSQQQREWLEALEKAPQSIVIGMLEEVTEELRDVHEEAEETERALAEARERERVLREALEDARHQLVTLDGLTASDGLDSYAAALAAGCDAGGAWDCYREATWRMDTTAAIKRIDATLAG